MPTSRPFAPLAVAALAGTLLLALTVPAAARDRPGIAGRLGSPTGFVPALRVHAHALEGGELHAVETVAGQAEYRLDLPPGRYWVFALPAEAGAPELYGAHTRFVLCARDAVRLAAGGCTDHALVEVEVGRRRVEQVDVTDWFLDDATAAEIDRVLGRSDGDARAEARLAAPRFSEYPAGRFDGTRPARIEAGDDPRLARDAAALARARDANPNFAGRIVVVAVDCEPECRGVALVDLATGRAYWPDALNPLAPPATCTGAQPLQFRRDSRLLTATGREREQVVTRYFVWNKDAGVLRQVAMLASAAAERCTAATAR